jgi:hypothetical protein
LEDISGLRGKKFFETPVPPYRVKRVKRLHRVKKKFLVFEEFLYIK